MIDKKSYKVLKVLYRNNRCTYRKISKITKKDEAYQPSKNISYLKTKGFLCDWLGENLVDRGGIQENEQLGYEITLSGQAYIQERRRNGRNFWVPYIITTLIAVIGLISSLLNCYQNFCK